MHILAGEYFYSKANCLSISGQYGYYRCWIYEDLRGDPVS